MAKKKALTAPHPRHYLAAQPVRELMSSPVAVIGVDAPLSQALNKLLVTGHRHLVVVDASGLYIGVLSDRLIAAEWARSGRGLDHCRVGELGGLLKSSVSAEATVADAAGVLYDFGADAVAVVDFDGQPVGVLAAMDLVARVAGRT